MSMSASLLLLRVFTLPSGSIIKIILILFSFPAFSYNRLYRVPAVTEKGNSMLSRQINYRSIYSNRMK
jgi:hypothetical protein